MSKHHLYRYDTRPSVGQDRTTLITKDYTFRKSFVLNPVSDKRPSTFRRSKQKQEIISIKG